MCTLWDQFGVAEETSSDKALHPLLAGMPKTTLTSQELDQIDSLGTKLYGDYWVRGLSNESDLTVEERDRYYALGTKLLSPEGFSTFYQGQVISGRVQDEIDRTARAFISVNSAVPSTLNFMPLTTITATEFSKVFSYMQKRF